MDATVASPCRTCTAISWEDDRWAGHPVNALQPASRVGRLTQRREDVVMRLRVVGDPFRRSPGLRSAHAKWLVEPNSSRSHRFVLDRRSLSALAAFLVNAHSGGGQVEPDDIRIDLPELRQCLNLFVAEVVAVLNQFAAEAKNRA